MSPALTPTPGEQAYAAYWRAFRPQCSDGTLPLWADIDRQQQAAWEAAAEAVLEMKEEEPMAAAVHTYPSNYTPGTTWAITEAWSMLDTLRPGLLDQATRAFLAGAIAGTLDRLAQASRQGQPPPS